MHAVRPVNVDFGMLACGDERWIISPITLLLVTHSQTQVENEVTRNITDQASRNIEDVHYDSRVPPCGVGAGDATPCTLFIIGTAGPVVFISLMRLSSVATLVALVSRISLIIHGSHSLLRSLCQPPLSEIPLT